MPRINKASISNSDILQAVMDKVIPAINEMDDEIRELRKELRAAKPAAPAAKVVEATVVTTEPTILKKKAAPRKKG
jgi:hypothetical protein